jgi:anti-anti-sigma factor
MIEPMSSLSSCAHEGACGRLAEKNGEAEARLHLEVRMIGGVMVVGCRGRVTYRNEAEVLSAVVARNLLQQGSVIFDLRDVQVIDSAGSGALLQVLQSVARAEGVVKIAASKDRI